MYLDATQIMDDAEVNGGGTYRYDGHGWYTRVALSEGYMVSLPNGIENVPAGAMSWRFIDDVLRTTRFAEGLKENGYFLGMWQDENGNWSVDLTEWVMDPQQAITLGVQRSQRAIWSNTAQTALDLSQMTQFRRAA